MTDLPEARPGTRPPRGPHVVVHSDGTRQHVFGGPNYRPKLTRWRRWGPLLAPAAITVLAVLWPATTGDTVTELVVAVGLTSGIWRRGR